MQGHALARVALKAIVFAMRLVHKFDAYEATVDRLTFALVARLLDES